MRQSRPNECLVPAHNICTFVISLSIETNCKQTIRVELKLTDYNKTLKGTTLCVWRNVTCCRSVTNVRLHFQCHYIIVRQRFLLGKSAVHHFGLDRKSSRKYWNYVLGNMNMTVNLWYINLSDERTNMNEWTSNSLFPGIPIQWHHEQVVQQRKYRATSRHSFITIVWWCNIFYQTVDLKGKLT